MKRILSFFSVLLIPHLCSYCLCKKDVREKIKCDVARWKSYKHHENYGTVVALIWVLLRYPEFRTLFYHRIGKTKSLFCRYLPGRTNLYIMTPSDRIGGGLYIGHGWGSVLNASSVGKNCMIGQNVTIGSRNLKEPVLQDHVSVWAHAVIIGDVTVGESSDIGAGAVIVKDIPPKSVVVPSQARIVKINGKKVNLLL